MFGIPGEVFWPTVAFGSIIMLVFGGVVLLRLFPKARAPDQPELDALNDLRLRLGEVDQLQARVGEWKSGSTLRSDSWQRSARTSGQVCPRARGLGAACESAFWVPG